MTKDRSPEKQTTKRWECMQGFSVRFPEPTVSASQEIDPKSSEQAVAVVGASYPTLRVRLRDMGLTFQPDYSQGEVAKIIRKTGRTVREWTRKGLISCREWPSGEVYYAAQDIEDILFTRERVNHGGK